MLSIYKNTLQEHSWDQLLCTNVKANYRVLKNPDPAVDRPVSLQFWLKYSSVGLGSEEFIGLWAKLVQWQGYICIWKIINTET